MNDFRSTRILVSLENSGFVARMTEPGQHSIPYRISRESLLIVTIGNKDCMMGMSVVAAKQNYRKSPLNGSFSRDRP